MPLYYLWAQRIERQQKFLPILDYFKMQMARLTVPKKPLPPGFSGAFFIIFRVLAARRTVGKTKL